MNRQVVIGGLVLGLAVLPGFLLGVHSTSDFREVRMDLFGCTETGPCLDLPRDGKAFRLGKATGPVELCLPGSRLGAGGSFIVNGEPVAATQWPEEFSFGCLEVDAGLGSGFIAAVRADGARSNLVPFIAAAVVERWEVPDEVHPGTSMFVVGRNLGLSSVLGDHVQEVRHDDDRIEFVVVRPGTWEVSVSGVEGATRTVTVLPRVERSCSAGPHTRCSLLVSHVGDPATLGVEVDGKAATITRSEGAHLELEWPEGLGPGLHEATVSVNGATARTTVEKLELDRETLLDFSPASGFIGRRASRPPIFDGHVVQTWFTHLTGSNGPQYEFDVLGRVPIDGRPRAQTSEGQFGYEPYLDLGDALNTSLGPHVLNDGDSLVLLGRSRLGDTLSISRIEVDNGEWVRTTTTGGPLLTSSRVAAARYFDGTLVWLEGRVYNGAPRGITVHGATVSAETAMALMELYADTTVGWLNEEAAFVTTCGAPDLGAGLGRMAVSPGPEGVELGELFEVYAGEEPERHLLACHGDEAGLYWVERVAGADRLMFLANGGEAPELLAILPAEGPGVGVRYERPRQTANDPLRWDPALMAMAVADTGDVFFVHGLRDERPGLALLRWRRQTDSFEQGPRLEVTMNAVRGELCIGPWTDREACGEIGQFGCNPFACDQGTALPVAGPEIQPWEADLQLTGQHLHLFATIARTRASSAQPFNRFELQYLKLPLQ